DTAIAVCSGTIARVRPAPYATALGFGAPTESAKKPLPSSRTASGRSITRYAGRVTDLGMEGTDHAIVIGSPTRASREVSVMLALLNARSGRRASAVHWANAGACAYSAHISARIGARLAKCAGFMAASPRVPANLVVSIDEALVPRFR